MSQLPGPAIRLHQGTEHSHEHHLVWLGYLRIADLSAS
jgi:hypothetical protein